MNTNNDIQSQVARVQQYGHPNVYANSENIKPPMKKEKIRVVEAATRAEINSRLQESWQERAERLQNKAVNDQRVIYEENGQRKLERIEQGKLLDIEA